LFLPSELREIELICYTFIPYVYTLRYYIREENEGKLKGCLWDMEGSV
jgi:hypothetical protein